MSAVLLICLATFALLMRQSEGRVKKELADTVAGLLKEGGLVEADAHGASFERSYGGGACFVSIADSRLDAHRFLKFLDGNPPNILGDKLVGPQAIGCADDDSVFL